MRRRTVLAAVLLAAGGCNSTERREGAPAGAPGGGRRPAGNETSVRLLVHFNRATRPADPAFLARLSKSLGMPIAYVRPMSGGTHVLEVSVPPESVADVVQRLKQRPEVVDVQADVPVRRQ